MVANVKNDCASLFASTLDYCPSSNSPNVYAKFQVSVFVSERELAAAQLWAYDTWRGPLASVSGALSSKPEKGMGSLGSRGLPDPAVSNTPWYQSFFRLPSRLCDGQSVILLNFNLNIDDLHKLRLQTGSSTWLRLDVWGIKVAIDSTILSLCTHLVVFLFCLMQDYATFETLSVMTST